MGQTTRADFAGTGKLWLNGTLLAEAAEVSVKFGGKLERVVTLGLSGENRADPNLITADIKGAVLRRQSFVARIERWVEEDADVRFKVQVGTFVAKATGKIGEVSLDTSQGKTSFSAAFSGDKTRRAA